MEGEGRRGILHPPSACRCQPPLTPLPPPPPLLLQGTGRPGVPMYRSWAAFARDARHNRLLLIPAALYAVNNSLKFAMQLFFKPTTAKMLSNLKVGPIQWMGWAVRRLGRAVISFVWGRPARAGEGGSQERGAGSLVCWPISDGKQVVASPSACSPLHPTPTATPSPRPALRRSW